VIEGIVGKVSFGNFHSSNTNSKDAFVSARAGYEMGVLVVHDLSKQYSIQAMAHWSQAEVKPRLHAALARISATP
jgi:hypothetical protein